MHVYVACLFCLQNLELVAHTSLYVCKTNLHLDDVLPVPEKTNRFHAQVLFKSGNHTHRGRKRNCSAYSPLAFLRHKRQSLNLSLTSTYKKKQKSTIHAQTNSASSTYAAYTCRKAIVKQPISEF